MVKNDQQETELEFRVKYSYSIASGAVWASGSAQKKVGMPWDGAINIKAKNGDEAKEKVKQELEQKLKDATDSVEKMSDFVNVSYQLEIVNAIQLGDQTKISSLSQYVVNEVERRFGNIKFSSRMPPTHLNSAELNYDNPSFAEQLIPLILNAVQTKQEVGPALDLVTERIKYDGPHTVGPDTHLAGFAGDAYVTYVKTFPALHFAEDTSTLRKLIRENVK